MLQIAVDPCPSVRIDAEKVGAQALKLCAIHDVLSMCCVLSMQVAVVRYLVGGPSLLKPKDMVRQDDAMARKSGGVRLSPDMVQKANRDFVNVLKRSGCSQVPKIVRVCCWALG